ncbi:hypothetical protein BDY17DRAFT_300097 [Neohortaea acidophila]|uniref:Uncharacterized protein n=1 Tax=Neohortaea acidophila TaxID=245834 RepID=A0A6A6PPR7_9PEZI|nr:uncharacterized protein BDY17DRAFT_300097 [Neohortaea acidophila]KAF2482012.1 hypothetical protein BDY17DRAFT_300097 [Neohortaea acidophila]
MRGHQQSTVNRAAIVNERLCDYSIHHRKHDNLYTTFFRVIHLDLQPCYNCQHESPILKQRLLEQRQGKIHRGSGEVRTTTLERGGKSSRRPLLGMGDNERAVHMTDKATLGTDTATMGKMLPDANRSLNSYARQIRDSNAKHAAELQSLQGKHEAWTKELMETQNIRYAEVERRLGAAQNRAHHFEQANQALNAEVKDLEQRLRTEQQRALGVQNTTTDRMRTIHTYAQRVKDMLHEARKQFDGQLQANRQFMEARRRYDEFMGRHGAFVRSFEAQHAGRS